MSPEQDLQTMVFDNLEPATRNVQLGKKKYVLVEASEGAATRYRTTAIRGATLEDGVTKFGGGMADVEPQLVSDCLYEADQETWTLRLGQDGTPLPQHRMPITFVNTLPARVVKPMFDWVKEVSNLGEKDNLASIDKQIERLQKRRQKLVEQESVDPKGYSETTTDTSS